jgi:sec-independent protein translocase protein TatA
MFGLQPTHILIIVVVALLFFGPQRLPELARSLGKSMKEFQGAMREGAKSSSEDQPKPQDGAKSA